MAVPCYLCMVFLLAFPIWFGYIFLCTPSPDSMDLITGEILFFTSRRLTFVLFEALRHGQQFFSHFGTASWV